MTTIVNLFGGPGLRKSTIARYISAKMSMQGLSVEYVNEYVKGWAWEKRLIGEFDQLYFFGQQAKKEYALLGKVDWVVTDSPVALCLVYAQKYSPKRISDGLEVVCKGYYDTLVERGHKTLNIQFTREDIKYDQDGRFESAEEAIEVDKRVDAMLKWMQFKAHVLRADAEVVWDFMRRVTQ